MAIYLIFILLVGYGVYDAIKNTRISFIKKVYLHKPIHWVSSFLLLIFLFLIIIPLYNIFNDTILDYSLYNIFGVNNKEENANIVTKPMEFSKYVFIPYYLLLLYVLPMFAHLEEKQYRSGITDWYNGVKYSIAFGLIHLIMGISFWIVIPLSVMGFVYFLVYRYFRLNKQYSDEDATMMSTIIHARYNILLISLLVLVLVCE
jgi:hypothetical protein